jgi:hypothetical protein
MTIPGADWAVRCPLRRRRRIRQGDDGDRPVRAPDAIAAANRKWPRPAAQAGWSLCRRSSRSATCPRPDPPALPDRPGVPTSRRPLRTHRPAAPRQSGSRSPSTSIRHPHRGGRRGPQRAASRLHAGSAVAAHHPSPADAHSTGSTAAPAPCSR